MESSDRGEQQPSPDRDSDSSAPPPLPASPPPVPGEAVSAARGSDPGRSRRWIVLLIVGLVVLGGLLVIGLIAASAAFYLATAKEIELTEEQEACVVTIADLAEKFEIEIDPALESWDCDKLIDGSAQVYYYYQDDEESIHLNCKLTVEKKTSDAVMMYKMEWGGLRLSNKLTEGEDIVLESADEVFAWGDESKFAFQKIDGERYGFAFVARKRGKVFFLDCWGLLLEDPEEISEFLTPHLEKYEKTVF